MKRALFAAAALACLLALAPERAHAQHGLSLGTAVRNAAQAFSQRLGSGYRIAVISMEADHIVMSNFLVDEMIIAFAVMDGPAVLDRPMLNLFAREFGFLTSQETDDETAAAIGRSIGVHVAAVGRLERREGYSYLFTARIIDTRTAEVIDSYSATIRNDNLVASLLGPEGRRPWLPEEPEPEGLLRILREADASAGLGLSFDLGGGSNSESDTEHIYIGAWFFMGARFFEWSFGVSGGSITDLWSTDTESHVNRFSAISFGSTLLLKRPFMVRPDISIAPLIGAGFKVVVATRPYGDSWWLTGSAPHDTVKFSAGIGGDFALTDYRFIRVRLLGYYGIRLGSIIAGADNLRIFGGVVKVGLGFKP